ncbi:hypothetical protein MKK63_03600 [Methylobacterium sp. J-088]|nr:hypothetical protein [Methylobacterium sp. GC_Met_2]MCJ2061787.1 hypothetical protein [Methylobacterium sp. J-088]
MEDVSIVETAKMQSAPKATTAQPAPPRLELVPREISRKTSPFQAEAN